MIFNVAVLLIFLVMSFSYNHKLAGRLLLVCQLVYIFFIVDLSGDYYYHVTALMNTIIAYILYGRYRVFSLLSFAFIPVCILGHQMYDNYYSPVLYDTLSIIITILQVLLLVARVMTDAITIKGVRGRALVRLINFDSFKQDPELSIFEKERGG